MFAAVLTTVFFSISVIFASRSAKVIGGPRANAGRITVALCFLALWAHAFGKGVAGASLPWFLTSGVIGFGFGDIALFGALPRIGPRLSILLTQCLAAPIAALAEYLWLGTTLSLTEVLCAALILCGVALALAPDRGWTGDRRTFWVGVMWGIGSAAGQALGAVFSRKAYLVASATGFSLDGGTAAYQRIIGGFITTWLALLITGSWKKPGGEHATGEAANQPSIWRRATPLILTNALAGPVMGVGCFQWALQTTASGIVLPIVATSPLVTMILTLLLDGHRPSRRALSGAVIAVGGAVLLKVAQAHS
jgi:drug/metabolite transporter (DMT)-like permease